MKKTSNPRGGTDRTLKLASSTSTPAISASSVDTSSANIAWRGRVTYLILAGGELQDMGRPTLVALFGAETEMLITGTAIDQLDLTKDNEVQGVLTIRRGSGLEVQAMSLMIDERLEKPCFTLRSSKNGGGSDALFSKRVKGGRICIVRRQHAAEPEQLSIAA